MNKQKLARVIKRVRLDNDMTLKEMADLCGLDTRTIWNLEHARVVPHERTIARISRLFPEVLPREEFEIEG